MFNKLRKVIAKKFNGTFNFSIRRRRPQTPATGYWTQLLVEVKDAKRLEAQKEEAKEGIEWEQVIDLGLTEFRTFNGIPPNEEEGEQERISILMAFTWTEEEGPEFFSLSKVHW